MLRKRALGPIRDTTCSRLLAPLPVSGSESVWQVFHMLASGIS
jgi:hypothetical protein